MEARERSPASCPLNPIAISLIFFREKTDLRTGLAGPHLPKRDRFGAKKQALAKNGPSFAFFRRKNAPIFLSACPPVWPRRRLSTGYNRCRNPATAGQGFRRVVFSSFTAAVLPKPPGAPQEVPRFPRPEGKNAIRVSP